MDNITTVSEDLRKVLGDPSFSDMVFVCGDSQEVHALRLLVAACSDVLRSMLLTSDMVETQLDRVPLPSMRGPIMRICLEFLYTDQVEHINMCAMRLDEVMGVIAAAHFFILPGLKKLAIDYCLKGMDALLLCCSTEDLFKAFNLAADLYQEQPHKHMQHLLLAFSKSIEVALNQEPERYILLSECGCRQLLANRDSSTLYSLQEYHLFVHAIKWCAYTSVLMSHPSLGKDGLQKLFDEFVPSSEAGLLAMLAEGCHVRSDNNLKKFKGLAEPMSKLLDKSCLDLSKIPSTILSMVFEPLDIFPSSKLLTIYKAQALRKPNLGWDAWCLHESYIVSPSNDTEIWCSKGETVSGFARSNMCIKACEYLFFEWEIVLLDACRKFRIGFCLASPRTRSSMSSLLGHEADSVALALDGSVYHKNKIMHGLKPSQHSLLILERDKEFKGTTFGVHIQLHTGMCVFKMNGEVIGQVSIPAVGDGVYPAVSLHRNGKARIRVVSHCSLLGET